MAGVAVVATTALLLAACGSSSPSGSSTASSSSSSGGTTTTLTGLTASAPGITPTTITIGSIVDISEPIPGLFKSAADGLKAWVAYQNSLGGIDGRQLVADVHDSAFNPGTTVSAAQDIIANDFASVGSFTLIDASVQKYVDQAKLPWIGNSLSTQMSADPNVYSPTPNTTQAYDLGPLEYFKQKYPEAVKHVGILYPIATASAAAGSLAEIAAMQHLGYDIVYKRGYGATESTFLPDVLKMKSAGVQLFFGGVPDNYAATIAREFQQENFHAIDVEGASYGSHLIPLAGGAAQGMLVPSQQALFLGEDAKLVPAVATFDHWINQVDPGFGIAAWGLDAWASGVLFGQALKNAGKNPTRASLMAALNKITSFDADGLVATANPAANLPSQCWMLAEVNGSKFERVSPPDPKDGGFVCNPGGLLYTSNYTPMKRNS